LTFSAIVLIVGGAMRVLDAVWALRYKGPVVDDLHDALFGHNLTTYGWVWLGVGVVLILSGVALLGAQRGGGAAVARWIGVVAAAGAAITAAAWFPYYPGWSAVYVAVGGLVIYGLVAHYRVEVARTTPKHLAAPSRVTGLVSADTTRSEQPAERT
jgi:hypothetical protein